MLHVVNPFGNFAAWAKFLRVVNQFGNFAVRTKLLHVANQCGNFALWTKLLHVVNQFGYFAVWTNYFTLWNISVIFDKIYTFMEFFNYFREYLPNYSADKKFCRTVIAIFGKIYEFIAQFWINLVIFTERKNEELLFILWIIR